MLDGFEKRNPGDSEKEPCQCNISQFWSFHRNNVIMQDYVPGREPGLQVFIELATKPNSSIYNGIAIICTLQSF